jgi:predicted acyl esterase
MDEPRFAVYVREWHPPGPYLEHAPGYWRWEEGWPIERIDEKAWYPQPNHTLAPAAPERGVHRLRYLPSIGIEAGGPVMWWGDVAHDQRPTDAFSLSYDSAPLDEELEILGLPKALLTVAADAPHANWFVRLSDVAPDGTVTQVAGAGMNGAHRNSPREPQALTPGEFLPLEIEMHFTSWVFPEGHRVRVSISNAQWPMLWPTPDRMTTSLRLGRKGGSRVMLPIVRDADRPRPQFLPPAASPELPGFETLDTGTSSGYGEISSVDRNPQTGEVTVTATNTGGMRYPWGTETYRETIEHHTSDEHPENTRVAGTHRMEVKLEDRLLLWEAELSFSSDAENFYYEYTRRLTENGRQLREKTWTDTIPRDHQ